MIAKSRIERNLQQINRLYVCSSSVQKGLFYSKLAILELCGWIEISMDYIVLSMSKRLIRDPGNLKYFEKEVVKRVHGFDYDQHFRRMLMALIGLHGIEIMEKNVNPIVFLPMRAALDGLKPYRDKHAHEYIKGVTLHLDAPSVTLSKLHTVYAGLIDIDGVLRALKVLK